MRVRGVRGVEFTERVVGAKVAAAVTIATAIMVEAEKTIGILEAVTATVVEVEKGRTGHSKKGRIPVSSAANATPEESNKPTPTAVTMVLNPNHNITNNNHNPSRSKLTTIVKCTQMSFPSYSKRKRSRPCDLWIIMVILDGILVKSMM